MHRNFLLNLEKKCICKKAEDSKLNLNIFIEDF